jgi:hypothetical protein
MIRELSARYAVLREDKEALMKPFTYVASLIFGLVAVVQLARVALGWPVLINGISIPLWASAVLAVIAGGMALMVYRENRGR